MVLREEVTSNHRFFFSNTFSNQIYSNWFRFVIVLMLQFGSWIMMLLQVCFHRSLVQGIAIDIDLSFVKGYRRSYFDHCMYGLNIGTSLNKGLNKVKERLGGGEYILTHCF